MKENMELRQKFLYGFRMLILAGICIWAMGLSEKVCLAAETPHSLQFFFQNVCASCHEEDDFYELFNRVISKEEKQELSYEIRTYNVFRSADMEVYEEKLAEYNMTRSDIELPVLLVDGQWISSYDKIEEELHDVLLENAVVSPIEENASSEENVSSEETDAFSEAWDSLSEQWNDLSDDAPAILLFSTYSCSDCESAKEYLAQLEEQATVSVLELNVSEGNNLEIFKELLLKAGRTDTEGKVPAVFVGDQMLLGKEEIKDQLETLLAEKETSLETLKDSILALSDLEETETIQKGSLPVMFGAGLLAGFNPCSISMLLMLFSILLVGRSSVLKNGLLYLGGKYITYFGIGLIFYLAASQIDQQLLNRFGKITGIVIAVLFAVAAVLNLMDFYNVRKQEYGKIRMQLPKKLRHFNHSLLKHAEHMEGVFLSLLVFGLGVAISVGEFFCSGQIYMASLIYLTRNGKEQLLPLIETLMVYVTAMSIPAAVILIVIYKTKKTERVSEFMLEHMSAIKLLNAVLFLAYAIYFIVDSIV
jgi:cytochrome c biogenesis protein CcdA/glutaredoxin